MSVPDIGSVSSFTAVQARMAQLDAMLGGLTSPDPAASTSSTGSSSSASSASFAAQLAAAGLTDDASSGDVDGLGTTASATSTGPTAQSLVAAAEKYIGTPYVWGGDKLSEGGLDCSGLVLRSMEDIGVTGIPRTAHEQMSLGTAVPSLTQAQPGDLLVFYGGKHIGIYLGNGKMIDSPHPGAHVAIRDVFTTPTAIRRVLPQAGASASAASLTTGSSSVPGSAGLTGSSAVSAATDATRLAALGMLQGAAS